MLRTTLACLVFCACSCGGASETAEGSHGPERLAPGLGDEETGGGSGTGPVRIEEEAVDPPPVEPPP